MLSRKETEMRKLVKLVARAYYEDEVVVLVDNLLDLSLTTHDRRVKEKDLATRVSLSVKHTHSHLMQLKLDRLVCGASMLVEEENDEGKNGKKDAKPVNKWKRPLQMFVWYFDYPLFVKIVKYKHSMILEKLSGKLTNQSDLLYMCDQVNCPLRGRHIHIMDLLMNRALDGSSAPSAAPAAEDGADKGGQFYCQYCVDTKTGDKKVLVLTPESLEQLQGDKNNLRGKFNEQIRPVMNQLRVVDMVMAENSKEKNDNIILEADKLASLSSLSSSAALSTEKKQKTEGDKDGATAVEKKTLAPLPWQQTDEKQKAMQRREEERQRKQREEAQQKEERRRAFEANYQRELKKMKERLYEQVKLVLSRRQQRQLDQEKERRKEGEGKGKGKGKGRMVNASGMHARARRKGEEMYKKGNGSNGENQNSGSNSHNNHRSNNSSNDLNDGSDSDDDIELDFEDVFGVADYGSARLKTEGMGHVITHGQQQQHLARSFPGSTKEKTDSEYFADLYNEQDFMQGLSQMMLTVQSKPVSASSLEQEDIDRMTEQEFEHYSQVVDSVQRQLLLTQDCV